MPPVTVAVAVPSQVPQPRGSGLEAVTLGAPEAVSVTDALSVQELASLTVTV